MNSKPYRATALAKALTLACLTLSAVTLAPGCAASEEPLAAEESFIAKPRDVQMALHLIQTADGRALAVELKGKLHLLACPSAVGMANLVRGLGFSPWEVPTDHDLMTRGAAEARFGESLYANWDIPCRASRFGTLYFVNRSGHKDYYANFNHGQDDEDPTPVLYMVGCPSLIEALGFDASQATEISQTLLDQFTHAGDENDMNCRNNNGTLLHPAVEPGAWIFRTEGAANGSDDYYLFNGKKAFPLTCASSSGVRELVEGAGYPMELASLLPRLRRTDQVVEDMFRYSAGATLDCDMSSARFLAISKNGTDSYWVESPAASRIFHRIGCGELAHAMGLSDLSRAQRVTEQMATQLLHVTLSADDDFTCVSSNDPL